MPDGILALGCGSMLVENTGYGAFSDRMARMLPCTHQPLWKPGEAALPGTCTGYIVIDGIRTSLPTLESHGIDNCFRFPPTRITFVKKGYWLAEAITAWGKDVSIDYPAEPILRVGGLLRGHMVAQPINNLIATSWLIYGGVKYEVDAPLPEAPADPGAFFGIRSYTVRPVTIRGTLRRVA